MNYFEIRVAKDTFKFNAAHFVAYKGFRERLHGHNYTVQVKLIGSKKIGPDGYVLDFGCVKDVTKKICKELNERFLCPIYSNVLDIRIEKKSKIGGRITTTTAANNDDDKNDDNDQDDDDEYVSITCIEDGSYFIFPKNDCIMLPIVHATAEELAIYMYSKILFHLDANYLLKRGTHTMEVIVAEAIGQEALFRLPIPTNLNENNESSNNGIFDVRSYIMNGDIVPMPCLPPPEEGTNVLKRNINNNSNNRQQGKKGEKRTKSPICGDDDEKQGCCDGCQSQLSKKLEKLAMAINSGKLIGDDKQQVTTEDLEKMLAENVL